MFLIFKIFPAWFWWILLASGLIGILLSYLPQAKTYELLLKSFGFVTIAATIFVFGMQYSDRTWQAAARELQAQIAAFGKQSSAINAQIQTKTITATKTTKEITRANHDTLKQIKSEIDAGCTLPVSSIVLHNSSSQGSVARGPQATDGTPSGVAASTLLDTVVENYGNCHENAERLKAWQQWYLEQKQIYEEFK